MQHTNDTRERLLSVTIELLHSGSYDSSGVKLICEKAGVQKGSLYHFFEGKEQLALAAIEGGWVDFEQGILGPAYDLQRAPLDRIREHFRLAYRAQLSCKQASGRVFGCFFGNLAQELATRNEPIRCSLEDKLGRVARHMQIALLEAREQGDLPGDCDPAQGAEAILAYLQGVLLMAKARNEPGFVKRHANYALRLVCTERTPVG